MASDSTKRNGIWQKEAWWIPIRQQSEVSDLPKVPTLRREEANLSSTNQVKDGIKEAHPQCIEQKEKGYSAPMVEHN